MRLKLLFPLIFGFFSIFGQSKTRLPFWTFNTKNTDVYGLAVGYMTTDRIEKVNTNGVRFELVGLGLLLLMLPSAPIEDNDSSHYAVLKGPYTERINGINLSPLGHGCDCKVNGINLYGIGSVTGQVNGISAGFIMNITERINGVQASVYFNITYEANGIQIAAVNNRNSGIARGIQISGHNETRELKGLQIGLYNQTKKIKGLQLGIWNVNEKRKLPILNF